MKASPVSLLQVGSTGRGGVHTPRIIFSAMTVWNPAPGCAAQCAGMDRTDVGRDAIAALD